MSHCYPRARPRARALRRRISTSSAARFDGWSVKRLSPAAFGRHPVRGGAGGTPRLPLRASPRRLCLAGPPRRAARPLQRRASTRRSGTASRRALARGFRSPRHGRLRLRAMARPGEARRPFRQAAARASAIAPAGSSSPAPTAASPRRSPTSATSSPASPISRRASGTISWFGSSGPGTALGSRDLAERRAALRLARPARLRERGGGALLQARPLLVAARTEADRRLSRQLQPRAFLRRGRPVGPRMRTRADG